MFIDSGNYKQCVKKLIAESADLRLAVAFWGKGAETLLESKSKKFRVICNLLSGGTNPKVIKTLLRLKPPVKVKHHDDLHAKVFIGEQSAIVGSANMSTNGLNIESDEFDGWQEAGFLTDQCDDVEAIGKWFERRWNESVGITPAMLKSATIAWNKRCRSMILHPGAGPSVNDLTAAQAKKLNIYVAFWSVYPSGAAVKFDSENQTQYPEAFSGKTYFEDGHGMKEGHEMISVHVNDDSLSIDGAYKRVFPVQKKENKDGTVVSLHYVDELKTVRDLRFNPNDLKKFRQRLLSLMPEEINGLKSWYVPLATVYEMLEKKEGVRNIV